MTLFLKTERRLLEISDLYVMAFAFAIFFFVGSIFRRILEEKMTSGPVCNATGVPNPRGGTLKFQFSDETKLANTILTCIADDQRYRIKNPELAKIIFTLVKAKIQNESLVLTPNMLRFLALKLVNNDQSLILKLGNMVASSNNQIRLFVRVLGAAVIGFSGALISAFPYAVLMMVLFFNSTTNCGYKCDEFFELYPKEKPAIIQAEQANGHIYIAGNDDAKQLEIYIPEKNKEITIYSPGKLEKTTKYAPSRKKAK